MDLLTCRVKWFSSYHTKRFHSSIKHTSRVLNCARTGPPIAIDRAPISGANNRKSTKKLIAGYIRVISQLLANYYLYTKGNVCMYLASNKTTNGNTKVHNGISLSQYYKIVRLFRTRKGPMCKFRGKF